VTNSEYREPQERAREFGLKARHELRLENATYTAAEVKVLTEAALRLGRKEALDGVGPRPWTTWRHLKTNSTYTILGVATCSTNGEREGREMSVVYLSHERQVLHYREISEFMDGRFEEVP
jgi:hypothetical protein